jgi:hypothetical protein
MVAGFFGSILFVRMVLDGGSVKERLVSFYVKLPKIKNGLLKYFETFYKVSRIQ